MIINGRPIGVDYPPFVIAEMSANHNGSLEKALRLVEVAKNCGADAVKLQTYTPDTITLNLDTEDFRIRGGLWDGRTLYDLYEEAHMPWDWHKPLFERARSLDITIFSSPFDKTAVDLLEDLNTPAYKIASFEVIDLPLIKYAASTGKPLIISTGMANELEIQEAIDAAQDGGCLELAVLHCISGYPAPAGDYNLRTIPDMMNRFGMVTGLSDHTLTNATAITSIALGASIIEKHFTLDRKAGGPDDSFSLEPKDLKALCTDIQTAWHALGSIDYSKKSSEEDNLIFRRSLYFVKDMKEGEIITESSIRSVRPGFGLPPKASNDLLGKSMVQAVSYGTAVKMEHFR
jgi:N-acetylneuraminate synthase